MWRNHPDPVHAKVRGDDTGTTLIEIVVGIMIIGLVGAAIIGSLFTTIVASRTERDHARAHQWLQSATEVLVNDITWQDCNDGASAVSATALQSSYQQQLRDSPAIRPTDWGPERLVVPLAVEFAGPSGAYGTVCYTTEDRQRVTIQVSNPIGGIIESVQVVKIP